MTSTIHDDHHTHHYEGVGYGSSTTPNKRSFTNNLVTYVKKTGQCVPRSFISPLKRMNNHSSLSPNKENQLPPLKLKLKRSIEAQQHQQAKRGMDSHFAWLFYPRLV